MPVFVDSKEIHRAERQDIRPLEIAIINLMADKISTERQLALRLGNTTLQVALSFIATDSYVRRIQAGRESTNTSSEPIRKFYRPFSEIKHRKIDGLIVTGVNAFVTSIPTRDP